MSAEQIIQQFKELPESEQDQVAKFIAKKRRDEFRLSSVPKVTVGDLKRRLENPNVPENKQYIINFIDHRLRRRFIVPIKAIPEGSKSGFMIMAVVCLLIETLQQFYKGDIETKNRQNAEAFKKFFEDQSILFPGCAARSKTFYTKIRCGILHQAETKGGYRILFNDGPLFDAEEKTINATIFLAAIEECFNQYLDRLRQSESNQPLWTKAIKKLRFICDNCQVGE
jgi:hypothetical protein